MAETHEQMFYEVLWRAWTQGAPFPFPWWTQQTFRHWIEKYDSGLFDTKEAAFASNALYRYWNMVGVKDHHQESLIGQSGEVEPVYDQYAVGFCLFEPGPKALHLPQRPEDSPVPTLTQGHEEGYLPIIRTLYTPRSAAGGLSIEQRVFSTVLGPSRRSVTFVRFRVAAATPMPDEAWLCVWVSPTGPTGFQRHDRAGRYLPDGRIGFLRYLPEESRVEVNTSWGPLFSSPPAYFGCYGNTPSLPDPDLYLAHSPFQDLVARGTLNGATIAGDSVAGLCSALFAWPFSIPPDSAPFQLDLLLPVDDYRGADDLVELRNADRNALDRTNTSFWKGKIDHSGLQLGFPPITAHLWDLYRICRANLLILADKGAVHPGPTIYDSFWVRDSAIEGIAAAFSGDTNLAEQQFGTHYPRIFNLGPAWIGPARAHGFFGGEHEKNDREWDSNGEALWAIGRFDRIAGEKRAFGARMFSPYVLEGARWIRDNRDQFGLLHSGWSAEHIGAKDAPHYWDDLWGLAGLYEAARLAERLEAQERDELWAAFDDLKRAVQASIRWVLQEQHRQGHWETFVPTGPRDPGKQDSTMIGALAYFHPCRLSLGPKLDSDIDRAFRFTLDTIWTHFMDGGFRHDSAWNAYGPYLTLQLAHAFLLTGQIDRMDRCLAWTVDNAAYAHLRDADTGHLWQVVSGSWNEQHAYSVAKNFSEIPDRSWYMGDIPHGWAAAELTLLLRDMCLYEVDEDDDAHLYLAAGIPPHWLEDSATLTVENAPTLFGSPFSYALRHDAQQSRLELEVTQSPASVRLVLPCHLGHSVTAAHADGAVAQVQGRNVELPAGTQRATIVYQ